MAVKAKQSNANFQGKIAVVQEIEGKLKNAKSVVFVNYQGLNTQEDAELHFRMLMKLVPPKLSRMLSSKIK